MKQKLIKAFAPQECDLCHGPLRHNTFFYDAATILGPWAWLCADCFEQYSVGLGVGRGQQYLSVTNEKVMVI